MSRAGSKSAAPPAAEDAGVVTRRVIPAWLLSGIVHFGVLILLVLFVKTAPRGADVEGDRKGGIVLVQNNSGKQEYLTESDLESSASQATTASQNTTSDPLPSPDEMPVDLAGLLPSPADLTGTGTDFGEALPDAIGLTTGAGPSTDFGDKTQTQVFGVRGVGSSFLYVFDRSGSMSAYNGAPLRAAKTELIASLQSLKSTDQFQIVFYNERPLVFNPTPGREPTMMFGTDTNKQLASDFIRRVAATGGTQHMPALKIALNLQADVVFFLTDAEEPRLSPDDLKQISRWNSGTSVNSIEFGSRAYTGQRNFLVRLAEENDGDYAYRNVSKFPVD